MSPGRGSKPGWNALPSASGASGSLARPAGPYCRRHTSERGFAHGASGTAANLYPIAERFAAPGMAALAFDYRDFGESGGLPRQLMHTERQREDWQAAVRLARSCRGIHPERIALWGTSFSGGT